MKSGKYFMTYDATEGCLKNNNGASLDWPCLDDQKANIWEVEPEEVFVWWDGTNFELKPPLCSGYKKYRLTEVEEK
jgi:hypothetical protein